jgi:hypothetical protein
MSHPELRAQPAENRCERTWPTAPTATIVFAAVFSSSNGGCPTTWGEQAWQASGLGSPPDIETLHRRNNDLVQDNVELRRRLDERDQELAAARAANRELMIKANRPGP